jgi:hypothetical protein
MPSQQLQRFWASVDVQDPVPRPANGGPQRRRQSWLRATGHGMEYLPATDADPARHHCRRGPFKSLAISRATCWR